MENSVAGTPLLERQDDPRKVRLYLALLAFFLFPLAAAQVVQYDILYNVVCSEYGISSEICLKEPRATKAVADLLSAVSVINGVVATASMASMAALSDRLGRRFSLVWNFFFSAAGIAAFPLVAWTLFSSHTSHWRMLVPYILTAVGGSPSLTLNLSVLYISDILHSPKLRTQYLSVMIGTFMLMQAIAPGVGSVILQMGVSTATYLSGCAILMIAAISMVVYSIDGKKSTDDLGALAHLADSARNCVDTISFKSCETHAQRRNAWIVLINFFFSNEFAVGFLDLLLIYAKHSFEWDFMQIGQAMFLLFSVRCAWALVGFPLTYSLVSKKVATQPNEVDRADLSYMVISSLLTLSGYIILSAARTSGQYKFGIFTLANDGIAGSIWVSSLLKHVPEDQKGGFLAALGLFIKPIGAFLPGVLMKIYQATVETSSVFFIVAAMATATTLSLFGIRIQN